MSVVVAMVVWLRCGSLPPGLLDDDDTASTIVVDRTASDLYEVRSSSGTRSQTISTRTICRERWRYATLAAEDVRFRSHVGLDPIAHRARGRARPAARTHRRGRVDDHAAGREAAARPTAGGPARGAAGPTKIHEAVVALRLEHRLTKSEILALYLNLAPYGNQIEGAERAAQAYFGRRGVDVDAGGSGISRGAAAAADAATTRGAIRPARGRAQLRILRVDGRIAGGWTRRPTRSRARSG